MALRRLRLITSPRNKSTDGASVSSSGGGGGGGGSGGGDGRGDGEGGAILAHWLAAADRSRQDESGRELWQIYRSPAFAELWYAARDAGERLRARAVSHLYANRAHPGGRYPDPREPATFSERAILATAARLIGEAGLAIMTASLSPAEEAAEAAQQAAGLRQPLAWLVTFPTTPDAHNGHASRPQLWLHPPTERIPQGRILFEMACLLGYITKERHLLDPDAPHGITLLPDDPALVALMHQFAIALLCLDPICPEEWNCHCNVIRHQFTAPPADHDQPTETLTMADLARQTRMQQDQRRCQQGEQRRPC